MQSTNTNQAKSSVLAKSSTKEQAKKFADGFRKGTMSPNVPIFKPGSFPPVLGQLPFPEVDKITYEPDIHSVATAVTTELRTLESTPNWTQYRANVFTGHDEANVNVISPRMLGASIYTVGQQMVQSREARSKPKGDFAALEHQEFKLPDVIRTTTSQIGDVQHEGTYSETYGKDDSIVAVLRTAHRMFNAPNLDEAVNRSTKHWLPCKPNDLHTKYVIAVSICRVIAEDDDLKNCIKYDPVYLANRMYRVGAAVPSGWDMVINVIPALDLGWLWAQPNDDNPDTVAGWTNRIPELVAALPELAVEGLVNEDFHWHFRDQWKALVQEDSYNFCSYATSMDMCFRTYTNKVYENTPGSRAVYSSIRSNDGIDMISGSLPFDNATGSLALVTGVTVYMDPIRVKPFRSVGQAPRLMTLTEWVLTTVK